MFRFPSRFFRYARAEDVKRLEVFEEFVTKRNGKKNGRAGPRIVIVGRICAAIKRGHLSRWRVVCEILLKTLSTSIEREREESVDIVESEEIPDFVSSGLILARAVDELSRALDRSN